MQRYRLICDTDGKHEVNLYSDDKEALKKVAKDYIKDGYFVFLEDTIVGELIEVKK